MQVILRGLHADESEDSIQHELSRYLHVTRVKMVRQGMDDNPWALVEVNDPYGRVWEVCNQLRGMFHRGKALRLSIALHQEVVQR